MEAARTKVAERVACRVVRETLHSAAVALRRTMRKMDKAAARARTFLVDSHPSFLFSTLLQPIRSPQTQQPQLDACAPETVVVTRLPREFVYANEKFAITKLDDDEYALMRAPQETTNQRAAASLLSSLLCDASPALLEVRWTQTEDGPKCSAFALDAEGLRPQDARALIDQLPPQLQRSAPSPWTMARDRKKMMAWWLNNNQDDHPSPRPKRRRRQQFDDPAQLPEEDTQTIVLLQRWVRPRSKRDHIIRVVWNPDGPLVALRMPIQFDAGPRRELNLFPSPLDAPITTPWLRGAIDAMCQALAKRIERVCGAPPKQLRLVCKLGESNQLHLLWCEECDFVRPDRPVPLPDPFPSSGIFVHVTPQRAASARPAPKKIESSFQQRDDFTVRCERLFGKQFTDPKDIAKLAYSAHVDNPFRQTPRPPSSVSSRRHRKPSTARRRVKIQTPQQSPVSLIPNN